MATYAKAVSFPVPTVDVPTTVTVKKVVVGNAQDKFNFTAEYVQRLAYVENAKADTAGYTGTTSAGSTVYNGPALDLAINSEAVTDTSNTLGNGDEWSFDSIPIGTKFTVLETPNGDYETTVVVKYRSTNDDEESEHGGEDGEEGSDSSENTTEDGWVTATDGVEYEFDKTTGTVTIHSVLPGMTIVYTNTRKLADLTIQKEGSDKTLDPDQTFIFHVEGIADTATAGISLDVVIKGNGAITIKDLPLGDYIVTEDGGWSWRYTVDKVTDKDNQEITAEDENYTVSVTVSSASVTFTNKRKEYKWMDGNSHCQNIYYISNDEITIKKSEDDNEGET